MSGEARWNQAWATLGARPPAETFAAVCARYTEAHRAYHTMQHLEECFAAFDGAAHLALRPAEIELALWFHDAIYDTHTTDNEAQSAAWAERALVAGGASTEIVMRVSGLVLATKHDALPDDGDATLFIDVDLSILGAPEARFDQYEDQVRREYDWVPDQAFREGRARILASFLARPRLYGTPWFADRLETQARRNLARSIDALRAPEIDDK